jgi:thiamine pyrophosphokinase
MGQGKMSMCGRHNKSVERLYQDIIGDFDSFKKTVTGRIKEFH